jgi:hypothetical protein
LVAGRKQSHAAHLGIVTLTKNDREIVFTDSYRIHLFVLRSVRVTTATVTENYTSKYIQRSACILLN